MNGERTQLMVLPAATVSRGPICPTKTRDTIKIACVNSRVRH